MKYPSRVGFQDRSVSGGVSMNVAAKRRMREEAVTSSRIVIRRIRYKYVRSMGSQQAITRKAHFSFLTPREL